MAEYLGQGVVFGHGDGAEPEVFQKVGEILSITGPNESAPQVKCTSVDDSAQKYLQGLPDGGEVSIEFNLDGGDAGQNALRADFKARKVANYKITLPDADTTHDASMYEFAALVTAPPSMKLGVDSVITASATLKVSGEVTFTGRAVKA